MDLDDIKLLTKVGVQRQPFSVSHKDRIFTFGSCFADNIGGKLNEFRFDVFSNPLGVMFNPISIYNAIDIVKSERLLTENDVFARDGIYNSFLLHSQFAELDAATYLRNVNETIAELHSSFASCCVLCLTFGTSFVYRLKKSGEVVSNCHKCPSEDFRKERLSVDEIVEIYTKLFSQLKADNPNIKIVMSVSPIRHIKDGAHENQLSKATLLLAVESLAKLYDNVAYFPAYEIMMDELRDYRFYAEDLIHPSNLAIRILWERFSKSFFSDETMELNVEIEKINRGLNHRPFNPNSSSYKLFRLDLEKKISSIKAKYPYLRL